MDFTLDEQQTALRDLARKLVTDHGSEDRRRRVEAGGARYDADLWRAFGETGLLGVTVPERFGGLGLGFLEVAVVGEELGRGAVTLPYLGTAVAAWALAEAGPPELAETWLPRVAAGDAVLDVAFGGLGNAGAELVVVVRPGSVEAIPAGVALGDGDLAEALRLRMAAGLCAEAAGATAAAVELTAGYVKERHQFGKPLASFQAVSQRAADAYVDAKAVRLTAQQAAWRLSTGLPAAREVAIAKFWASEGGQRVMEACVHLHGGIGVDRDYPLHRYYERARAIDLRLGSAPEQLVRIGNALAS